MEIGYRRKLQRSQKLGQVFLELRGVFPRTADDHTGARSMNLHPQIFLRTFYFDMRHVRATEARLEECSNRGVGSHKLAILFCTACEPGTSPIAEYAEPMYVRMDYFRHELLRSAQRGTRSARIFFLTLFVLRYAFCEGHRDVAHAVADGRGAAERARHGALCHDSLVNGNLLHKKFADILALLFRVSGG